MGFDPINWAHILNTGFTAVMDRKKGKTEE